MTIADFIDAVNPDALGSWAEIEIRAAVRGFSVDERFCRFAVVMGMMIPSMTQIVAEGILSSASWECVRRDEGIVDDIIQSCIRFDRRYEAKLSRRGVPPVQELIDDFSVELATKAYYQYIFERDSYIQPSARKYMLLDAVERRFPALPVKYYAANARKIHETDEELAIWIKQRLAEKAKTSETFRKIYESMAAEFVDNHFSTVVFMK